MDTGSIQTGRAPQILADDVTCFRIGLDKVALLCTPAQSFDAECASTAVEVEHGGQIGIVCCQKVEDSFSDTIRGGADTSARRPLERPPSRLAANHTHAVAFFVGQIKSVASV